MFPRTGLNFSTVPSSSLYTVQGSFSLSKSIWSAGTGFPSNCTWILFANIIPLHGLERTRALFSLSTRSRTFFSVDFSKHQPLSEVKRLIHLIQSFQSCKGNDPNPPFLLVIHENHLE